MAIFSKKSAGFFHILRIPINIEAIKSVDIKVREWVIITMWKRQHQHCGSLVNQQRLVSGAHGLFVECLLIQIQVMWLVVRCGRLKCAIQ